MDKDIPQALLAQFLEQSLVGGFCTPNQVIGRVPPKQIMMAFESAPDVRANLLVTCKCTSSNKASHFSVAAGAELLQVQYDVGETEANDILDVANPAKLVQHVPHNSLGPVLFESGWYRVQPEDEKKWNEAQSHVFFIIDESFRNGLLDFARVQKRLDHHWLAVLLTRSHPERAAMCLTVALDAMAEGRVPTPDELLGHMTTEDFVETIPLNILVEQLLIPMAVEYGWIVNEAEAKPEREATTVCERPRSSAPAAKPPSNPPGKVVPLAVDGKQIPPPVPYPPAGKTLLPHPEGRAVPSTPPDGSADRPSGEWDG